MPPPKKKTHFSNFFSLSFFFSHELGCSNEGAGAKPLFSEALKMTD